MAVETLIPVDEYLNTLYDPEVEYVDGILLDRHNGDWSHSSTHGNIIFALHALHAKYPNVEVLPSLTVKTAETHYRIPDVCVVLASSRS